MAKIYAGIGSRDIDSETEVLITQIGVALANEGWALYSGGADGSDFAFEKGCDKVNGSKKIFLPWKGFGHKWNRPPSSSDIIKPTPEAIEMAKNLAKEYPDEKTSMSPDWYWFLLGRNMHQILGRKLEKPVNNVICYTKNGEDVGGTRWALRIARKHEVKIYNIGNPKTREKFERWLKSISA